MKVEILKVKDGIIEPLGDDMAACMTGCGGGSGMLNEYCNSDGGPDDFTEVCRA